MRGLGGMLGDLAVRSVHGHTIRYDVTDERTGEHEAFTVHDGLAPDWGRGGYRGGLSIPGAARATAIISDIIGALPWDAYRKRTGRPLELLPTPPLLDQPHPIEQRVDTFSAWAMDLLWEGNAVGIWAARDRNGVPTAVLPVPAEWVFVRYVDGILPSQLGLPEGEIEYRIGGRSYTRHEIMHVRGPHKPGFLRGHGVLERHFNTMRHSMELDRQARAVSHHGVPTGVLELGADTRPEDAVEVKKAWLRSQRDRTIAAIANGSFKPISWNPEEMQLIEARKFSLHEWALIFGLPFSMMGVEVGSMTYSNLEAEALNLLKTTMLGHLARFEQTLSAAYPRGTTVKANLNAVLRADTLTRYQAHKLAVGGQPFLTVDEVREIEDRGPMPATPADEQPDGGNPDGADADAQTGLPSQADTGEEVDQ